VLTRRPDSGRAAALVDAGASIVEGDLDDVPSLERALSSVHGVFIVTDCWEHGLEREVSQALTVAEAATRAQVRHVVYGSVAGAHDPAAPPHLRTKGVIEAHIERLGLPFTFLRPAFFMEMFDIKQRTAGWRTADLSWSFMRKALGATKQVQLIAVDDIGRAAADAFDDPENHLGAVIELAGDALTFEELETTLKRHDLVRPRKLPRVFLTVLSWFNSHLRQNFQFIEEGGWQIDITAERRVRPWLTTFDEWSRERAESPA
jgi:uncharacterized protein YbjT (DUF2867 family)